MNADIYNEKKIRILCFGDSNTWGYSAGDGQRFSSHIRWTGVLQKLLGDKYQVIEEGLNGRTTNIDYPDRHGKSGQNYLYPCLDSHCPLDYVILSLGPNDMKAMFQRTAQGICEGIEGLIKIIKGDGLEKPSPNVKIILVGPPKILEGLGPYADDTFAGATQKSVQLAKLLPQLAKKHNCIFVDLFDVIHPSPIDGTHLSVESHQKMAQIFYQSISVAQ